eukprot:3883331-Rhodomonas_salina.1
MSRARVFAASARPGTVCASVKTRCFGLWPPKLPCVSLPRSRANLSPSPPQSCRKRRLQSGRTIPPKSNKAGRDAELASYSLRRSSVHAAAAVIAFFRALGPG